MTKYDKARESLKIAKEFIDRGAKQEEFLDSRLKTYNRER